MPSHDARWTFLGSGTMGAAALARLLGSTRPLLVVSTPPDRYGNPVLDLVAQQDLPVAHSSNADGDERLHDLIAGLGGLDAGVVCVWDQRLTSQFLSLPRHGWLNLHPSRLPQWRGGNPISWQMLTSPGRLHCSVHWMTEELDRGPVVARATVALEAGDDFDDASRRCGEALGAMAADVLTRVAAGAAPAGEPQPEDDATACPPLGVLPFARPARMTARQLVRVLRAFSPTPGVVIEGIDPAERMIGGRLEADPGKPEPGSIRELDDGYVVVACTDGSVRTRKRPPV